MDEAKPEKIKILLVDDIPNNLIALEAILDSPQYEIVSTDSGYKAIELVQQHDFALVLLDIQMPGMDGYETARRIKNLPQGRDLAIIFVTAIYREEPDVIKGYDAGAIDYFSKPFNPDVLKAKVNIYTDSFKKNLIIQEQERRLVLAEAELEHERTLKTILETLTDGVIIVDRNGKITQANEEAARIWGGVKFINVDQYSGYVGWWADSGERIKSDEWAIMRALKQGETIQRKLIRIQAFDGVQREIMTSASPLKDRKGKVIGAVSVIRDLTNSNAQHRFHALANGAFGI